VTPPARLKDWRNAQGEPRASRPTTPQAGCFVQKLFNQNIKETTQMTKTNKILAISLAVMILLTASLAFLVAAQNGPNGNLDEFDIVWLTLDAEIAGVGSFIDGRAIVWRTQEREYVEHMGMISHTYRQRQGVIDKTGNLIVPMEFDAIFNYSEGLAAVAIRGENFHHITNPVRHWGFIDRYGEIVIPLVFDSVSNFSGGLATVVRDGQVGIISNPLRNPDTITLEINRNLDDNNVAIVSFFDQNTYLDATPITVPHDANNVRINLWNGFENMRPLMPAIELYQ